MRILVSELLVEGEELVDELVDAGVLWQEEHQVA
jgi:hypothetical protein